MLCRFFTLLITLLLFSTTLVNAQSDEIWYFALTPTLEPTSLIAYNADGDMNTLLEADTIEPNVYGTRLGTQLALIPLIIDGTPRLYVATPDLAQPIELDVDTEGDFGGLLVVDYAYPYILLTDARRDLEQPVLLANLETLEAEIMPRRVDGAIFINCCRFSEDGTKLRYTALDESNPDKRAIWELDLATGEERIVHELPDKHFAQPDTYGERWLLNQFVQNGDTRTRITTMLNLDGTSEVIDPDSTDTRMIYQIFKGNLFSYPFTCESECDFQLQSLTDTESTVTYRFGLNSDVLYPTVINADNNMVAYNPSGEIWSLKPDSVASLVGYFSPQSIAQSPSEIVSFDGRYVLALDTKETPQEFYVWDNQREEKVLSVPKAEDSIVFPSIRYYANGFLVADLTSNPMQSWFLRYADEELIQLPAIPAGNFIEVLSDNALLYRQIQPEGDKQAGLYRYDIDTDTFTLLAADAEHINTRDIQRLKTLR